MRSLHIAGAAFRAEPSTAATVALALGGAARSGAQWLARCPIHPDRTPSLALRDGSGGRLLVHCHAGCKGSEVLSELYRRGLVGNWRQEESGPALAPLEKLPSKASDQALELWRAAGPLPGTLGEAYLARRMLNPHAAREMRFLSQCPRGPLRQPAIILLMRDAKTNEPRAIQRRFLRPNGEKDGPAMSLGPTSGTVWKLSPDEDVTFGLGIAEGHADALAAYGSGFAPIWATAGTAGMANFAVLKGVEKLTIFRDLGEAGRKASMACAARWRAAGREAVIITPKSGSDFAEQVEVFQ